MYVIYITYTENGITKDYQYQVYVNQEDNHGKSVSDPLSISEAIAIIDANGGTETSDKYFVECLITGIQTAYDSKYDNVSYWATDDESVAHKFCLFRVDADSAQDCFTAGTTVILETKLTYFASKSMYETTAAPTIKLVKTVEDKANEYANAFNAAHVCGTNDNTSATSSVWLAQKSNYEALDSYTRDYLSDYTITLATNTINECLTRYERVIELHGSDTVSFPNFMNRSVAQKANKTEAINDSIVIIFATIGLLSFTALVGFISFRKKREIR